MRSSESLCESCRHCRWMTSGNGWDEPKVSEPDYCELQHKNFDRIPDDGECDDYAFDDGEDDYGPDPMDAYKQYVEDRMLGLD